MKVSDKLEPAAKFALVLTADGKWERRVLTGLAPKLDGKFLLWFPPPLGRTGLQRLAEAIKVHLEEAYGARPGMRVRSICMLILVDKEHFRRPENARPEFVEALMKMGIDVLDSGPTEDKDAFFVNGKYGHRPFKALVAILGIEKCLDEQIALLLKQYKNIQVEPNYGSIMRAMRSLGEDLEDIIAERSLAELKRIFPSILAALRSLERLLAEG